MQISKSTYPLLLTILEPDSPYWNVDHDGALLANRDVCEATYEQGETLAQDRLTLDETIANQRQIDEDAVGLSKTGQLWFTRNDDGGGRTLHTVVPGEEPRAVFQTGADELVVSAGQRYVWARAWKQLGQWDNVLNGWTTLHHGEREVTALSADPARERLLFALRDSEKRTQLYSYEPGSAPQPFPTPVPIDCSALALSPEGDRLAFVDPRDRQVKVCDLDTGLLHTVSNDAIEAADDCPAAYRRGEHASPAWSPDGRRLFYTRSSEGVDLETTEGFIGQSLFVANPDGSELRCLASAHQFDTGIFKVVVGRS